MHASPRRGSSRGATLLFPANPTGRSDVGGELESWGAARGTHLASGFGGGRGNTQKGARQDHNVVCYALFCSFLRGPRSPEPNPEARLLTSSHRRACGQFGLCRRGERSQEPWGTGTVASSCRGMMSTPPVRGMMSVASQCPLPRHAFFVT